MSDDDGKSPNDQDPKDIENQPRNNQSTVKERSEYFEKLEKWLQEAYVCQSVAAMFPYYVMSTQMLNPAAGNKSHSSDEITKYNRRVNLRRYQSVSLRNDQCWLRGGSKRPASQRGLE